MAAASQCYTNVTCVMRCVYTANTYAKCYYSFANIDVGANKNGDEEEKNFRLGFSPIVRRQALRDDYRLRVRHRINTNYTRNKEPLQFPS